MALTPAEKQRRYRERQAAELKRLRALAAKVEKSAKKTAPVKKAKAAKKKG